MMDKFTINLLFIVKAVLICLFIYSLIVLNNKLQNIKHGRLIYYLYSIVYLACVLFIMNIDNFVSGKDIPKYSLIIFCIAIVNYSIVYIYYRIKKNVNDN